MISFPPKKNHHEINYGVTYIVYILSCGRKYFCIAFILRKLKIIVSSADLLCPTEGGDA